MALVGSGSHDPELGRFKDGFDVKFEVEAHVFVGSIEAVAPVGEAQVTEMSIEFGFQYEGGKRRQAAGTDFRDT